MHNANEATQKTAHQKIADRYTVLIEQDKETGQCCVTVPALPECVAFGDIFREKLRRQKS